MNSPAIWFNLYTIQIINSISKIQKCAFLRWRLDDQSWLWLCPACLDSHQKGNLSVHWRLMTKSYLPVLALALLLTGCGGGGSAPVSNAYVGTWSGTWTSIPADTGTGTFTVATDGSFTGQVHDNNANTNGTDSGTISNTGEMTVTVSYPGSPSYTLTGQFSFNQSNQLVGTVSATINNQAVSDSFTLTKQ